MKTRTAFVVSLFVLAFVLSAAGQQFGPWSRPTNIGTPVNSGIADHQPFITRDGLSLYFTRLECITTCPAGTPQDIWVSHRADVNSPWQEPERLPEPINSSALEGTAFVSIDGHFLFFTSNRAGGLGGNDLYVSRRQNKRVDSGPDGWETPVNLGTSINSSGRDQAPVLFENENTGQMLLYFNSNRSGNDDIYFAELLPDGKWSAALPVAELNTTSTEQHVTLSRDGLEIYFVSDRPGGFLGRNGTPWFDIWTSSRENTSANWSEPKLVAEVCSMYHETRPWLSFDGKSLYFGSSIRTEDCLERGQCNVSDAFDIWVATREKLTGPNK